MCSEESPTNGERLDVVEQAGIESFPASDPPSWTLGVDGYGSARNLGKRLHLSDRQLAVLKLILERKLEALCSRSQLPADEQTVLVEVVRALHKLQSGGYGYSERSGCPIPFAWLALLPWVRCAADEL